MRNLFKCDRCGAVVENLGSLRMDDQPLLKWTGFTGTGSIENGVDFCAKCCESLRDLLGHWVKGEEPVGWR